MSKNYPPPWAIRTYPHGRTVEVHRTTKSRSDNRSAYRIGNVGQVLPGVTFKDHFQRIGLEGGSSGLGGERDRTKLARKQRSLGLVWIGKVMGGKIVQKSQGNLLVKYENEYTAHTVE
jgi:hypothetical protein